MTETSVPEGIERAGSPVETMRAWLVEPAADAGIHLADEADGWQLRDYPRLAGDAWSIAATMRARGLAAGDGVCVLMPTGFGCAAAFYAVWACGGVLTPIAPPMYGDLDQYYAYVGAILRQARPRLVMTSVEFAVLAENAVAAGELDAGALVVLDTAALAPAPAERVFGEPGPCALLQFTSGSTGAPRGVRVSWRNLANNVAMISDLIDWRPGEAMVSWLPLYHDMGLVGAFFTTITNQGALYLMRPDQFVRDPARWLRAMTHAQHSPSPSFALGYVAHRVRPDEIAELDLSGWRTLAVGSEPVEVSDLQSFADLTGPQGFSSAAYTLAYGLAEATLMVTSSARDRPVTALRIDPGRLRFGAPVEVLDAAPLDDTHRVDGSGWITGLGFSTAESTVRVVDDEGNPLPDGTLGEMTVVGDSVALGYSTASEGASTRIEDGVLHTGDAGFLYHGEVFVLGRMGTSLKVRGRPVFMEDLESRIAQETGITKGKLAAVAITDPAGPGVALFAEAQPGDWVGAARRIARAELGPARTVLVVTGPRGLIRRTSSGKPRRRHMWQLFGDGALEGATVHGDDEDGPGPSDLRLHALLDAARADVDLPAGSAVLFEGSLAEGFGNAGSDIDFLVVAPGEEELPTLPTVLFVDGRRVEIRTRSLGQLRAQLAALDRSPDEDLLNRCQRFLRARVLTGADGPTGAELARLRERLPLQRFGEIAGDWWAARATQALRHAVALRAFGAADEAADWLRDGLVQAAKSWAARRGETYLETKWLPRQLDRLAAEPLSARCRQLTAPGSATGERVADVLALARELAGVDVTDDPDRVLFVRVPGVTTWQIGERIHLLRDRDVFVLSAEAGHAWRAVVFRRSIADIAGRIDAGRLPLLAEFVALGLVGLQWRGGDPIRPALAMCRPVRPVTPAPGGRPPLVRVSGAPADGPITLSPLPARRFTECALNLVWSNVVAENAREDLAGAVADGQGAVADLAAHRLIAMGVRIILSAYGIQPLPADVAPAATVRRSLPDDGLRARLLDALDAARRVRFSAQPDWADGVDTLDRFLALVRETAGGRDFPASFDSGEQWRRTLSIGYDWLRIAGYLDAELPLDEVRDLLTSGGRQPHRTEDRR